MSDSRPTNASGYFEYFTRIFPIPTVSIGMGILLGK